MSEERFDDRVGLRGEYEPLVCAVTGQHVSGRHNTAMRIRGNYFFRVLDKTNTDPKGMEAIGQKLLKLLPKETRKREVNHDKQP